MHNLVESILSQCPENITKENVMLLIEKHKSNPIDILSEVWQIEEKEKKQKKDQKHDWDNIREICNEYESEMESFMNSKKT